MKTYSAKMRDVRPAWHVIDATDQPLGRLATRVATLLRGKHKPIYQPNLPVGDFVVVINAERVRVSGDKAEAKTYYRHSQYPGGLKTVQFRQLMEKHPTRAVEKAVRGMLPHNSLGRKLFTRLKVYAGPEHPHAAQVAGFPPEERSAVSRRPSARAGASSTAASRAEAAPREADTPVVPISDEPTPPERTTVIEPPTADEERA